jgi:DNA-binding NarL/FixJ family response regulator
MPPKQHRIFIVDDHPLYRLGLVSLLTSRSDFVACGEAADSATAIQGVQATTPDAVLVDLSLGNSSGLETLRRIKELFPSLPVLVLSMHLELSYAPQALLAGASGYLSKDARGEEVLDALRKIISGGLAVSRDIQNRMLHATKFSGVRPRSPLARLSQRELDVFGLMGKGLATRQIADELAVSIKTIESHRANIKDKLSLNNSNELVREAIVWAKSRQGEE